MGRMGRKIAKRKVQKAAKKKKSFAKKMMKKLGWEAASLGAGAAIHALQSRPSGGAGSVRVSENPGWASGNSVRTYSTPNGMGLICHEIYSEMRLGGSTSATLLFSEVIAATSPFFKYARVIGSCFEQYAFKRVRVTWRPLITTFASGRTAISWDQDAADEPPNDVQDVIEQRICSQGAIYDEVALDVPVDGRFRRVAVQGDENGSGIERSVYTNGRVIIGSEVTVKDPPSSSVAVGCYELDYVVEFRWPTLDGEATTTNWTSFPSQMTTPDGEFMWETGDSLGGRLPYELVTADQLTDAEKEEICQVNNMFGVFAASTSDRFMRFLRPIMARCTLKGSIGNATPTVSVLPGTNSAAMFFHTITNQCQKYASTQSIDYSWLMRAAKGAVVWLKSENMPKAAFYMNTAIEVVELLKGVWSRCRQLPPDTHDSFEVKDLGNFTKDEFVAAMVSRGLARYDNGVLTLRRNMGIRLTGTVTSSHLAEPELNISVNGGQQNALLTRVDAGVTDDTLHLCGDGWFSSGDAIQLYTSCAAGGDIKDIQITVAIDLGLQEHP